MPGTRCVNCRWWNGDRKWAPTGGFPRERRGKCFAITNSSALPDDHAAILMPFSSAVWIETRFDFTCGFWEKEIGAAALTGE